MSRCIACDTVLSDSEMCAKDANGNYWDMCSRCKRETYESDFIESTGDDLPIPLDSGAVDYD